MGLADVDEKELGAVSIGVIKPLQVARLATEGRSGVAAEDEDDGLVPLKMGQGHGRWAGGLRQGEVWGAVADLKLVFVALAFGRRRIYFPATTARLRRKALGLPFLRRGRGRSGPKGADGE
jgi:hypothetical protein